MSSDTVCNVKLTDAFGERVFRQVVDKCLPSRKLRRPIALDCLVGNRASKTPSSVITADVTDTYRKYKAAMIKLRTLNWMDSRNTAEVKMSGVLYNPNSNLAMSWSIHLKKATPDGTIFLFNHVNLRVIQIDQLNTAMQRTVGILSIVSLLLLGYVAKVEIDRCQRIKITSGHYRDAMRSVSLWGSVVMIVFFVVHLILRALYFFNAARRNFDIKDFWCYPVCGVGSALSYALKSTLRDC